MAVRVRPLGGRNTDTVSVVRLVDDRGLVFDPKAEAEPFYIQGQQAHGGLVKPNKDQSFMFAQVLDETKGVAHVFEHTTKDMPTKLFKGCSCFGAAAAGGKTYTMQGLEDHPGVVSLTFRQLYHQRVDRLRSTGPTCKVAVVYFEVCKVCNALCPANGPSLLVLDDPAEGISNLCGHEMDTVSVVRLVDDRGLGFDPKAEAEPFYIQGQQAHGGLVKPNKDQSFMFAQVLDETKGVAHVFEHTTKDMLTKLFKGCSCFGAAAAGGKTYTMQGLEDHPGVVSLTFRQLYHQRVDRLRSAGPTCKFAAASLEVYNEAVSTFSAPTGHRSSCGI
ncbi:hypothetical protein HPB49_022245 [Dermacentor silvarum]|uniref:Uncharacterized protein n=1 Tax=Dermacentor silvarum TaxID=543639 RepID=A0ACB8E3C9_DERSI|nr:hypothetical protein HPB49_022245 [Dermacentor silvarum]